MHKKLYTKSHGEIQSRAYEIGDKWGKNEQYFYPTLDGKLNNYSSLIALLNPKSILDYGCGYGLSLDNLQQTFPDIKMYYYDPFVKKFKTYPTIPCDLIISVHALNNIEDEYFDEALQDIHTLCLKNGLFSIKLYQYPEHKYFTRQENWYIDRIAKLFKIPYKSIWEDGVSVMNLSFNQPMRTLFLWVKK